MASETGHPSPDIPAAPGSSLPSLHLKMWGACTLLTLSPLSLGSPEPPWLVPTALSTLPMSTFPSDSYLEEVPKCVLEATDSDTCKTKPKVFPKILAMVSPPTVPGT